MFSEDDYNKKELIHKKSSLLKSKHLKHLPLLPPFYTFLYFCIKDYKDKGFIS